LLKLTLASLFSIPIASYCSIKRLAIIIFSCAILDHLLMRIGIIPIRINI
jgi:hypothetical protein